MNITANDADNQTLSWFSVPSDEHVVQFYVYDDTLLDTLVEFIGNGLKRRETCIVVATKSHALQLDERLKDHANTRFAKLRGDYIVLDAHATLANFMVDGTLDKEKFADTVGSAMAKAASRGRPIRAFGEMVALLWKQGNKAAMIELEELWNELAETYNFSLYCAYPKLYFDNEEHAAAMNQIASCHHALPRA
jgi:hypothetical protein